jgi:hypothetical protein
MCPSAKARIHYANASKDWKFCWERTRNTWIRKKVNKAAIEEAFSVIEDPLRSGNSDHLRGDALHILEGMVTHITEETYRLLDAIKQTRGGWAEQTLLQEVDLAQKEANLSKTPEFKEA